MSIVQRIPLQPETTDQVIKLELGGSPYEIRVLWNERFEYFSFSIFSSDGAPILLNIKMVKNYPITKRFKNTLLPIGDFYFIQENGNSISPGYSDLNTNFFLYYYEKDSVPIAEITRFSTNIEGLGTVWDSNLSTWDFGDTLWDQ